jgi:HlyD family secretion protein
MKKIAAIVVLLGIAAGLVWQFYQNGAESGAELRLYGNVDIREVQLGFRVGGRLQAMYFEEGDKVEAGDLMAALDDEPLRQALAVAAARLMEAQAMLDRANTGSRPQEILQAQARVSEAEAALENARRELKRQRGLMDSGLSSQRQLDVATADHDQAAARLEAAQEALALAVEGSRVEDISAAQAALAAALAQRDQAGTQLQDAQLFAPSPGIVLTRAREPGSMLAAGTPVYSLSLADKVYVRAYVAEPWLGRVIPGTPLLITTDSSDRVYHGQVGFVSPRAEFTPKTVETPELRTDLVYRLRIVVSDADAGLRQGMPVTVVFAESRD